VEWTHDVGILGLSCLIMNVSAHEVLLPWMEDGLQKDEVVACHRKGLDCCRILLRLSLKIAVSAGRSEEKPGPQM